MLRGPSSFANAFLYVGLGTVAIGLVISFVGTGEKGFKTVELRLIGPSLIGLFTAPELCGTWPMLIVFLLSTLACRNWVNMLYPADFILHMPFELYNGPKAAQQEDEQGGR